MDIEFGRLGGVGSKGRAWSPAKIAKGQRPLLVSWARDLLTTRHVM